MSTSIPRSEVATLLSATTLALESGRHADAVTEARAAEAAFPSDSALREAMAGVYIDAGLGLADLGLVDEGIRRLEPRALGIVTPADKHEAGLVYHLANGYAARQTLRVRDQASPAPSVAGTRSLDDDTRVQRFCIAAPSARAGIRRWSCEFTRS